MSRRHSLSGLALVTLALTNPALADERKAVISQHREAAGVDFHYLEVGQGDALLLLHGYTETSHLWRPLLNELGRHYHVIAPDLPGFGDSSIPETGLDMKHAALRVHALLEALGVTRVRVVGHDIGMMVAYAYAAEFPSEVGALVAMDARMLPGVGNWESVYHEPGLWHFSFNGRTAEELVRGRERIYFEHFWNDFAAERTRSVSPADRRLYTESYARPGRMRAAWSYFAALPQTARDFAALAELPLPMPVLVLTGEKAGGRALAAQFRLVARNVTELVLPATGHFVVDERPREVEAALLAFLDHSAR